MKLDPDNWGQWIVNDGVNLPQKGLIVWAVFANPVAQRPYTENIFEIGLYHIIGRYIGGTKSFSKHPGYNPVVKYRIYKSKGYKEVEDLLTTLDAPKLLLEDKTKDVLV
jgi:hypothetical protein